MQKTVERITAYQEKPSNLEETKQKNIRSLSLTCNHTPNKRGYRRHTYGYNDKCKKEEGIYCKINGQDYNLDSCAQVKTASSFSRRRSRRRFYEPSVERFPPVRVLKSGFKTLQEMPFWRLDANRFRRIILDPKLREIQEQKMRIDFLNVLPFFGVSMANSKDIFFMRTSQEKLKLKQLRREKKMAKAKLRHAKFVEKKSCKSWKEMKKRMKEILEVPHVRDVGACQELYRDGGLEIITNCSPLEGSEMEGNDELEIKGDLNINHRVEDKPTEEDHLHNRNETMALKTLKAETSIHYVHKKITICENSEISEKHKQIKEENETSNGNQEIGEQTRIGKVAQRIVYLNKQSRPISACRSCERSAYNAESIKALGQVYHNSCFKCATCSTLLQRGSWNHSGDRFYCNPCHRRLSLQTLRH